MLSLPTTRAYAIIERGARKNGGDKYHDIYFRTEAQAREEAKRLNKKNNTDRFTYGECLI